MRLSFIMGFKKELNNIIDKDDNLSFGSGSYSSGIEELVYTKTIDNETTELSILYSFVGSSAAFDYYWFMPLSTETKDAKLLMNKMVRWQDKNNKLIVGPLSPVEFSTNHPQLWKRFFSKKDTDEYIAPFVMAGDQALECQYMKVKYKPNKQKALIDEVDDDEDIIEIPLRNGLVELPEQLIEKDK